METRKVTELSPNPLNPRGEIARDVALRELAMSIKSVGLLQPLVITPQNIIIAGHRWFVAAQLAELEEVSVIVRDVSETDQLAIMLAENMQRRSLNPIQEGKAFQFLVDGKCTLTVGNKEGQQNRAKLV